MAVSYVMTFAHVLFIKRLQRGMCINLYNYKLIVSTFEAVGENFIYIIFVSH